VTLDIAFEIPTIQHSMLMHFNLCDKQNE